MYPFKTIGPFGGSGGTPWDDGVHTDVREINIHFAGHGACGIGIVYDNKGSLVQCSHHGRKTSSTGQIKLDYPKERLVSISGSINRNGNSTNTIIYNLRIRTTETTYKPFGRKEGSKDGNFASHQNQAKMLQGAAEVIFGWGKLVIKKGK
ncbi:jacalin-related lectin 19-like [Eucalyptus grandis]|uniref:jacalin-related lectin 19-like n=1 Tax=Eucalyptus grandis TaxID=71139 RepID=UPI00192EB16E|nr:jacalin-related lectin 19-like [Eucalyptus grandis]